MIFKFKIKLKGSSPPVWRRVLLSADSDFDQFHQLIQTAMGWQDEHEYDFQIANQRIEAGSGATLAEYFSKQNKKALYTCNFAKNLEHEITLEKIMPFSEEIEIPLILGDGVI